MSSIALEFAHAILASPDLILHTDPRSSPSLVTLTPSQQHAVQRVRRTMFCQPPNYNVAEASKFCAAVVGHYYRIAGHYLQQDYLRSFLKKMGMGQQNDVLIRSYVFGPGFKGPLTYLKGAGAKSLPYLVTGGQAAVKMTPRSFLECVKAGKKVDPSLYYEDAPRIPTFDESRVFAAVDSSAKEAPAAVKSCSPPSKQIPASQVPFESASSGVLAADRVVVKVRHMHLSGVLMLPAGVDLEIDTLEVTGNSSMLQVKP